LAAGKDEAEIGVVIVVPVVFLIVSVGVGLGDQTSDLGGLCSWFDVVKVAIGFQERVE
jgi:hypothetical protein